MTEHTTTPLQPVSITPELQTRRRRARGRLGSVQTVLNQVTVQITSIYNDLTALQREDNLIAPDLEDAVQVLNDIRGQLSTFQERIIGVQAKVTNGERYGLVPGAITVLETSSPAAAEYTLLPELHDQGQIPVPTLKEAPIGEVVEIHPTGEPAISDGESHGGVVEEPLPQVAAPEGPPISRKRSGDR